MIEFFFGITAALWWAGVTVCAVTGALIYIVLAAFAFKFWFRRK